MKLLEIINESSTIMSLPCIICFNLVINASGSGVTQFSSLFDLIYNLSHVRQIFEHILHLMFWLANNLLMKRDGFELINE